MKMNFPLPAVFVELGIPLLVIVAAGSSFLIEGLLLKGGCILAFLSCLVIYRKRSGKEPGNHAAGRRG